MKRSVAFELKPDNSIALRIQFRIAQKKRNICKREIFVRERWNILAHRMTESGDGLIAMINVARFKHLKFDSLLSSSTNLEHTNGQIRRLGTSVSS